MTDITLYFTKWKSGIKRSLRKTRQKQTKHLKDNNNNGTKWEQENDRVDLSLKPKLALCQITRLEITMKSDDQKSVNEEKVIMLWKEHFKNGYRKNSLFCAFAAKNIIPIKVSTSSQLNNLEIIS